MRFIQIIEIHTEDRPFTITYRVIEPSGRETEFTVKDHAIKVRDAIPGSRLFEVRTTIIAD
jgi:hypothetical protein